jgi:hypothetical protein
MGLHLVHADLGHAKAELITPRRSGYLYIAASVHPGAVPIVLPNRARTQLLRQLRRAARDLEQVEGVVRATVFRAIVRPPTARFSKYLQRRKGTLREADFDVIMLIETTSPAEARSVRETQAYLKLIEVLQTSAHSLYVMAARNGRRINDVQLERRGLFLFNHFAADDPATMLQLWDHLAGWYVAETGLRNSVALVPLEGERTDYAIVNWAEWDTGPLHHFWKQLSKPSFWRFVTANLEANRSASMPIYCRLVA